MNEQHVERRVGAWILAGLAAIGVLFWGLSRQRGQADNRMELSFGYVAGLPVGAPVKVAGVPAGRVLAVTLDPQASTVDSNGRRSPVRVTVGLDGAGHQSLRADALATIGTQGALGEMYVELLPGDAAAPLDTSAPLRGLDPPRLDVVFARAATFLEDAADDRAFRLFLTSVASVATSLDRILNASGQTPEQMAARAGALLNRVESLAGTTSTAIDEARGTVAEVRRLVRRPETQQIVIDASASIRTLRAELPDLLKRVRELSERLDKTTASLGPGDVEAVRSLLARYQSVGTQLDGVATRAERILAAVEKGEGTLGKVAQDPQVYEDLRALLADLKAHPWKLVWK